MLFRRTSRAFHAGPPALFTPDLPCCSPPDLACGSPPDLPRCSPPDLACGFTPDLPRGSPPDLPRGSPGPPVRFTPGPPARFTPDLPCCSPPDLPCGSPPDLPRCSPPDLPCGSPPGPRALFTPDLPCCSPRTSVLFTLSTPARLNASTTRSTVDRSPGSPCAIGAIRRITSSRVSAWSSQLPPAECALRISGWRRSSALAKRASGVSRASNSSHSPRT